MVETLNSYILYFPNKFFAIFKVSWVLNNFVVKIQFVTVMLAAIS